MALVNMKGISKRYGKTEVIHGIDCLINDGEFVVILGPSGCGKSTLLRMVAGLESISRGEIKIAETIVNDLEPASRNVAMVFQNYALYPHMSVFNNMAYGLKIRRMPKDLIAKKVQEAAEILELTDLLQRKPRQLSGGQRQRVAMGRCIVRDPKVFLFDEPLSNLDAKLRVQMRLELRSLHERLRVTSIYVTHDQVEAMTLGDRLLVMHDGRSEQLGTPLEIYEKPETRFVAGFIGSPAMNFFEAEISDHGRLAVISESSRLRLQQSGIPEYSGHKVLIGIRPEHFEQAGEDDPRITLKVSHTEILGADTYIYGRLLENQAFLTIRLPHVHHIRKDTLLALKAGPEQIHCFDQKSGQRITPSESR